MALPHSIKTDDRESLKPSGGKATGFSRTVEGFSLVPALILCATFIAYIDTVLLGFVFDDHVLIVTNDSIRSWRYLPAYFTSHIWFFRYPHLLANYYRPLFLIWLRVNHMLFGLNPRGWHVMSLLAHLAATYLVYCLAQRLTRDSWVAAVAAFLFGLHPVHAEAVADITSIQEPLSTIFILGAVLAFARSRDERGLRWRVAALGLTAAALLAKESGMIVPLLIALWVLVENAGGRESPDRGNSARLGSKLIPALQASIPFWLVVLAYVPARIHALKGFAHAVTPRPLATVIYTIPSVLAFYLRLLLWPAGLSCYYDTPYVTGPAGREFVLPAILLFVLVCGLAVVYFHLRRRGSPSAGPVAFASVWIFLTILPVLNFRFLPEGEIAHDRYLYLPSVGVFILAAMGLQGIIRRIEGRRGRSRTADSAASSNADLDARENSEANESRGIGVLAAWSLAAMFFAMGVFTARQNLFWADDFTLNARAHEIAPHNVYATSSLAAATAQQGMQDAAMDLYRQALTEQPRFWRANVNMGYLEYARGDYGSAAHYFSEACSADPSDGDQFLYLGMSLFRLGRFADAESAVRSALLVRPQGKNYHLGLGMVLRGENRLPEARREIETELAADPDNAQARNLLEAVRREIESSDKAGTSGRGTNLK